MGKSAPIFPLLSLQVDHLCGVDSWFSADSVSSARRCGSLYGQIAANWILLLVTVFVGVCVAVQAFDGEQQFDRDRVLVIVAWSTGAVVAALLIRAIMPRFNGYRYAQKWEQQRRTLKDFTKSGMSQAEATRMLFERENMHITARAIANASGNSLARTAGGAAVNIASRLARR